MVPKFRLRPVALLSVRVVREAPGSKVRPLNCWTVVTADLPAMSKVPPPSSSELAELIIDAGAALSALKLSWSVPPRTMVLPL